MADAAVSKIENLSREALNMPASFSEELARVTSALETADFEFVGNPYELVKNKDALLERPFFIRQFRFNIDDETKREFVSIELVTQDDYMLIVNDGSTGIYAQLKALAAKREKDGHPTPTQNVLVSKGLRKSDYFIENEKGGKEAATTYYLG